MGLLNQSMMQARSVERLGYEDTCGRIDVDFYGGRDKVERRKK